MITRKVTVTVAKPSAQVFKFVGTDYFVNHPKWDPKVVNLKLESAGPVAVGTHGNETRKQGSRTVTYSFEVTDFKPGSQMAFKASGGPMKLSTSYLVKPLDGNSAQLEVELKMQMGGIMRLFEPFMSGGVKKEADTTVATIKKMIEGQAAG